MLLQLINNDNTIFFLNGNLITNIKNIYHTPQRTRQAYASIKIFRHLKTEYTISMQKFEDTKQKQTTQWPK